MKKNFIKLISISCIIVINCIFVSCNKGAADVEKYKQENDSLLVANAKTKAEYEEVLTLINEIQNSFSEIKSAENYLIINNIDGETGTNFKEKIVNDLTLINDILNEKRDKINELQQKLNDSNNESAQIKTAINTLNKMIEEKAAIIIELQKELEKRDIKISQLDNAVITLSQINENLNNELNSIFYALGTSKELRENKIMGKRGRNLLKENFNKDYFTSANKYDVTSLDLGCKKAEILTTHPNGSYSIEKDNNEYLILKISDPDQFWSTSRYLVIKTE